MASLFGDNIKISIFGESHGKAIGVNIDGLPAGIKLDIDAIIYEIGRRAPGQDEISTSRKEKDEFEILSGYFNERTTGTPLCAIFRNEDKKSRDYEKTKNLLRPSHADYSGFIRYKGFNDYRGGGHFSGRLTAPIVFAGAIAKEILKGQGILIGSHIMSIGRIEDDSFDYVDISEETLQALHMSKFPVLDEFKGQMMREEILKAKKDMDSLGGVIETAVLNLEPGIGEPYFDGIDAILGRLLFSIPGVKGVEFGAGFDITGMKGSQANDEMYMKDGEIRSYSNNSGGVVGGISNGMPLIFRAAIKPTSSIGKEQRTVDIARGEDAIIKVEGRHDPSIVQRAVPVVDAVTAIGILDLLMEKNKWGAK